MAPRKGSTSGQKKPLESEPPICIPMMRPTLTQAEPPMRNASLSRPHRQVSSNNRVTQARRHEPTTGASALDTNKVSSSFPETLQTDDEAFAFMEQALNINSGSNSAASSGRQRSYARSSIISPTPQGGQRFFPRSPGIARHRSLLRTSTRPSASNGPSDLDIERQIATLQPADIPVKINIKVSFKSLRTKVNIAAPFLCHANHLADLNAFCNYVRARHANALPEELFTTNEPKHWILRCTAENGADGVEASSPFHREYACDPNKPIWGLTAHYGQLMAFCSVQGRAVATRLVHEARSRLALAKSERKSSEWTAEGRKREPLNVRVPREAPVYAIIDIFF
ncbi:hypothetical protein A1O3_07510 [Capronia epimyces CBS 606.96]|uniref:Uncharacterized protein n=1 Tax=Capronia epimyces CBS 606.96 TaxID=1182542 RepID=W9XV34_9EURO|nr:uncharacterized protein A1O3_07510 [Capronia epimyces CBS 606.96]EXJ81220.1 hypothetical protein A1O3_07510 [Capronia epimyces CBS 606.96]